MLQHCFHNNRFCYFQSGSFLVLRTEAANVDPPLWKIDGKSLLQKYSAFMKDGKVLYKNTAEVRILSYHKELCICFMQNVEK